ncbi:MAG: hypothetical protein ABI591_12480 [Kofleriaceae bacterium]
MRWLAWLVLAAACNAASPELGYDAVLQVPGAQFRPGAFPDGGDGPPVLDFIPSHTTVVVGMLREQLTAHFDPAARGAILGVVGDAGAWIVPVGAPDVTAPGEPRLVQTYGLAETTPSGPLTLEIAATDADGVIGAPATIELIADEPPPPINGACPTGVCPLGQACVSNVCTAALMVSLVWDSTADLDLHVVDPLGGEAYSANPNTWQMPAPGSAPPDPNAYKTGGILDRDANASCAQSGNPEEDVSWQQPAPSGTYVVRVEPVAMCKDASARWYVAAYAADGSVIAAASGVSTAYDVSYGTHGKGGGVTALMFALP